MTEEELHQARMARYEREREAHEAELDAAVGALTFDDALSVVSRREAQGGTDREARRHNMKLAAALRLVGMTQREIAEEMGIDERTVRRLLSEAKQLDVSRAVTLLHQRAVPQAMDNLITGLERGNERYTIETLKGAGILKAHGPSGQAQVPTTLQLVFAAPPGQPAPALPAGAVHGAPLTLETQAEKVE